MLSLIRPGLWFMPPLQSEGAKGWSTIEKIVKDTDGASLQKCKDDIDTLLVFSGLFSAVLTAFLVESYQSLSPDPQVTVINLLSRIADQSESWIFSNGFLNTTNSTPGPSTSFHPADVDVFVNACWFASLVICLVTASTGLIVRQWLCEYLLVPYTYPIAYLRISRVRYQNLRVWKVYEIARTLPFLLQFSLTLFLVGLCAFAKMMHPVIAMITFSLVGLWALLWLCASLAPLIWAGCPYSATSLPSYLRRRILHLIPFIQALLHGAYGRTYRLFQLILVPSCLPTPHRSVDATASTIAPSNIPIRASVDQTIFGLLGKYSTDDSPSTPQSSTEQHLSRVEDLRVLRDVDSILLDDTLIGSMRAALPIQDLEGTQVLQFVVSIIGHRLYVEQDPTNGLLRSPSSLSALSAVVRLTLVSILADILLHQLHATTVDGWHKDPQNWQWMDDALLIIVALLPSRTRLPEPAYLLLRHVFQPSANGQFNGCDLFASRVVATAAGHSTTDIWQAKAFSSVSGVLKSLSPQTLTCMVHWSYLDLSQVSFESATFQRLLDSVENGQPKVHPRTLRILVEIAASTLHSTIFPQGTGASNHRAGDLSPEAKPLLEFIIRAVPIIERLLPISDFTRSETMDGVSIDILFMDLVSTPTLICSFLESLSRYPELLSKDLRTAQDLVFGPLSRIHLTHRLSNSIQLEITNAFATYFDAACRSEQTLGILTVLRLCLMFTVFPVCHEPAVIGPTQRTFTAIANCIDRASRPVQTANGASTLRRSYVGEIKDCQDIAYLILHLMDADDQDGMQPFRIGRPSSVCTPSLMDEEDGRYSRWAAQFNVETSLCPHKIVESLFKLTGRVVDRLGRKFWRIRFLEDTDVGDRGQEYATRAGSKRPASE
ncbi:hypothetical protein EIP86_006401 [Pleurotus ostreatoroseus]|nr:hypothetical protein EIP86_006401 [Pleurotus ostreatoroseus]